MKKYITGSNITVDLYEAGAEFNEVGAGITLWERTRSIFRILSLAEAIEQRAVSPPFTYRKSDTKEPFSFHKMEIPRASLHTRYNTQLRA